MVRWQTRGDLLRWWRRDVAQLSQRQLAEELGVARTAVTNWERGSRMASIDAERIDSAMKADGVLAGWLWSFGTPEGFDPRQVWSHAFSGPSTPVWMWIRSPDRLIGIEAEWGMYRLEGETELGENGFLVIVGVSIEASPVAVRLSAPGWVDFGRGEVPEEVAGAPVVDAVDMVMPSSSSGVFTELLATNIVKQFEDSKPPEIVRLTNQALKPGETFLATPDDYADGLPSAAPDHPAVPWPALPPEDTIEQRARYARLREARQLSLLETSHRLATMTDTKAGRDTLRRFEANIGEPHDRLLPVALDHVLGAGGHLAQSEIGSGRGAGVVNVPRYWTDPVWIAFEAVDDEGLPTEGRGGEGVERIAELQWGNWHRLIEGHLPLLIINHSAMIPLRIITGSDVRWTAGVGHRPGATSIDHDWAPDSIDTTQQALSTYQQAFNEALRHATEHRRH